MRESAKISELVLTFMKIGLFTFGGGYAMISLMDSECVTSKKWISHDELMDITVIAESTPGPIAINCATYIGYQQAGIMGAVLATVGIVLPSFIVIFLISQFFENFLEYEIIADAFAGIKLAVSVLILSSGIKMVRNIQKKRFPLIIMICSFLVVFATNMLNWRISSIYFVFLSGVIGYASSTMARKSREEEINDLP